MKSRAISVVLPAYRASAIVAETVASVRSALSGAELEIIVVDDGSGDDTDAEARRGGADRVIEFPQLSLIHI